MRVSFGDVFIRPQAWPDGAYQRGTIVTLVVSIPESVAWTGVDNSQGNEASVAMHRDRSVGVFVVGPAPMPTATPVPASAPTPSPTPAPVPTGPGAFTDSGQSLDGSDSWGVARPLQLAMLHSNIEGHINPGMRPTL